MTSKLLEWISAHPRRSAILAIVAVFGLVLVVLLTWAIGIAGRAERLATDLKQSAASAESAIAVADEGTIGDLSASLIRSRDDARRLDDDLWPLRWSGAVVGWVPFLGDNVTGVPDLVARLNDDLDAAIALVAASELLVTAYTDIQDADDGLMSTLNSLPGDRDIEEVRDLIVTADVSLLRAEEKAASMRDGRLFGRIGAESTDLRSREARLREMVDWMGFVTESLSSLSALGQSAAPLAPLFEGGGTAADSLDNESLQAMPQLEPVVAAAFSSVSSANANMPGSVKDSAVGRALIDFEPILEGLHGIARAGSLSWNAVSPALETVRTSPGGLIGKESSLILALESLADSSSDFSEASDLLGTSKEILGTASPESPVARRTVRTLESVADELARAVGFLSDFPAIGPQTLGADGERRYLVLGQTSDELRGSGGFVSGVWEMTFNAGELVDFTYHDVVEVDDRSKIDEYPLPPELLATHMDAPVWLMRDSTWSPSFPSAAQTAADIFEIGQGGPRVDGVIAITQWAIVSIARAMGTIETDRGAILPEEVIPTLEEGSDVEGRAFVDSVFRGVVDGMKSSGVNERLLPLALSAAEVLERKDTMIFMFDPGLQEVVSDAGWDGSFAGVTGDRLAVVDSNVGWNKVDRNIVRSVEYVIDLEDDGPSRATLVLGYDNQSSPGYQECELQVPRHESSYADLKQGCYWNLVRTYVHSATILEGNLPLETPEGSVTVRSGSGLPGEDSVGIGAGPGGKFVSGLLVVPAGESAEAQFELLLPPSVVFEQGDGLRYALQLTAQAGVIGRETAIRLNLPQGFAFSGSSPSPDRVSDGTVEFLFSLESDMTLEVDLSPSVPVAQALNTTPGT